MSGGDAASAASMKLQDTWSLHFQPPKGGKQIGGASDWESSIKSVASFDNVEDFWRLFNNLSQPSDLQVGSTLHLFKEGIQPAWEDPHNQAGGAWYIPQTGTGKPLNTAWLNLILHMVGDQFEYSEEICGISVAVRKFCRIELWVRNSANREACEAIGRKAKVLADPPVDKIEFKDFESQIAGDKVTKFKV